MPQAGKYPSNIHVPICTVLTHTLHRHGTSYEESMDWIWIRTLGICSLLKCQLHFPKPKQASDWIQIFFFNLWENIITQFMTRENSLQNRYVGESNRIQHLPIHLANNMEDLLYIFIQMKILSPSISFFRWWKPHPVRNTSVKQSLAWTILLILQFLTQITQV